MASEVDGVTSLPVFRLMCNPLPSRQVASGDRFLVSNSLSDRISLLKLSSKRMTFTSVRLYLCAGPHSGREQVAGPIDPRGKDLVSLDNDIEDLKPPIVSGVRLEADPSPVQP